MKDLETKKFKKGQVISKEGAFELWMYDLRQGSVALYDAYGTEEEQLISVIQAPGFFGEMGMLESMPRFGTTVALDNVELKVVNMENFEDYFRDKPAKVMQVLEGMCSKLRRSTHYHVQLCDYVAEYIELKNAKKPIPEELEKRIIKAVSFSKKIR